MKFKAIILVSVLALASCKTTSVSKCPAIVQEEPKCAHFAQATPSKDTLYLLEKDPMAIITHEIWSEDTAKVKPAIIFVSNEQMTCIKKRCNGQIKEIN
jgi:hypothetical protein